jgi:hypothetical protein
MVSSKLSRALALNGQVVAQTYQPSYCFKGLNANTAYQISVMTVMSDGEQSLGTDLSVPTEPLPQVMTVTHLENHIFSYLHDIQRYFELLFAVLAAFLLAHNLKLSLKG